MKKLIELWKTGCGNTRAAKPLVKELESEGYVIEKLNINTKKGKGVWEDYVKEINLNSKKRGYPQGYIYTPTFINPKTREALAIANSYPSKAQLIKLGKT